MYLNIRLEPNLRFDRKTENCRVLYVLRSAYFSPLVTKEWPHMQMVCTIICIQLECLVKPDQAHPIRLQFIPNISNNIMVVLIHRTQIKDEATSNLMEIIPNPYQITKLSYHLVLCPISVYILLAL